MGRDSKQNSAFASGMRGREKPKIASSHGGTMNPPPTHDPLGNEKQEPGKSIGMPGGIDHTDSVYSSGMRGLEAGKQKKAQQGRGVAGDAGYGQSEKSAGGGENHQKANTTIGNPDGERGSANDAPLKGQQGGVDDAHIRTTGTKAYKLGIPGNNTELASSAADPIGAEEDDTHINIRVPKKSITKRQGRGQAV